MPRWLDDYILTGSSLGHRDDLTSKKDYCYHLYYNIVIDNILGEMNKRFSESNKKIMKTIQSCSKSDNYLDFEALKPLVDLYSSKLPPEDSTVYCTSCEFSNFQTFNLAIPIELKTYNLKLNPVVFLK